MGLRRNKITVVGAGFVGATAAHWAAAKDDDENSWYWLRKTLHRLKIRRDAKRHFEVATRVGGKV